MSASIFEELTDKEIAALPAERVAKLILHHLTSTGISKKTDLIRSLGLTEASMHSLGGPISRTPSKLDEVIDWMFRSRLIISDEIRGDKDVIMLTKRGIEVGNSEGCAALVGAVQCTSHHVLNPALRAARLRLLEGQYDLALEEAVSSIEARIRSLSLSYKRGLSGRKLVNDAFRKKGRLAKDKDKDRVRALKSLFRAVVDVGITDVVSAHQDDEVALMSSASEVILLCNLLLRYLDQYATSTRRPRLLADQ